MLEQAIGANARTTDIVARSAPRSNNIKGVRVVVGGAIGLAGGFGGMVFGSLAIFLKPIAESFGWSRAEVASAVIMSMLGLALGAPLQGSLMERHGRRFVIGASVAALAVMLAALSFISSSHFLFGLCWLVLGLTTAATGPNGYLSLLPALFDRRLGLALSCAMVGIGAGAAASAFFADAAIRAFGWRDAYRILAVLAAVLGSLAILVIGRDADASRDSSATVVPVLGLRLPQALRDRRILQVACALGIAGGCGLGMTVHTAAMLSDRGFTPTRVASVVAMSGVGLMLGRLAGGILLDHLAARLVGAINYLFGAIAVTLLGPFFGHAYAAVLVAGLMLGTALGAEGDFAAFVVRRYAGTRAFASIYGFVFSAFSIGSIVGVILCGWAYDHFGDYRAASAACTAGYLVAAGLVLTLGPYRFAAQSGALPYAGDILPVATKPTHAARR